MILFGIQNAKEKPFTHLSEKFIVALTPNKKNFFLKMPKINLKSLVNFLVHIYILGAQSNFIIFSFSRAAVTLYN